MASKYILSICAAAIICGFLRSFFKQNANSNTLIELLCSIFMILTILQPFYSRKLPNFSTYMDTISWDAEDTSSAGVSFYQNERNSIITQQTIAYILDKAAALDAHISAEVSLTNDTVPVPDKVNIRGKISPGAKAVLEQYIETNLDIAKENQIWN